MTEDSSKNNHKYFCLRCRDRNWLIECACECGDILSRTDERYRIRKHIYGHYQKESKGELNPNYKGGRSKIGNYWRLHLPDYFSSGIDGNIREHVYFYQEYHKCCVLKWAIVHHIDPVREGYCNNMPWNLTTMMRDDHIRYHNTTTRVYIKKNTSGVRCSECGSDTTYIRKNGSHHWLNDGKGGRLCLNCYGKRDRMNKKLL
jgi:hypothetical protein